MTYMTAHSSRLQSEIKKKGLRGYHPEAQEQLGIVAQECWVLDSDS